MKRAHGPESAGRHHLDTRAALDYLEGRLPETRRRALEHHLGGPCPECRARLREIGMLLDRMRLDRVPEVPDALRRAALAAFPSRPALPRAARVASRIARLLFDSLTVPTPAAVRRAVGEARRLRFELGDRALELEAELVSSGTVALRGRLSGEDAALHAIEVVAGRDRFQAWPDADGAFGFDRLPAGPVRIAIAGPAGRYRLPALTL